MPSPVLLNLWACNRWNTEYDREAAGARELYGPNWAAMPEEVAADTGLEAADDAGDPAPSDWYDGLVDPWPDKDPGDVIPWEKHIGQGDYDEVRRHWNLHWRKKNKPDDKVQCFDFANFQLHKVRKGPTGLTGKPESYYHLFTEAADGSDVTDVPRSIEAVMYLTEALAQNIPVLVGIRMLSYAPRPNKPVGDPVTNHFVVVVGMAHDTSEADPNWQHAFLYYDYLTESTHRFYLQPSMAIVSKDGDRRVSQVRRTIRR